MMYNKIVEDCFFSPIHVGMLDLTKDHTSHVGIGKKGKGTVIDFYLQCNANGLIERACFKAIGNPYTIAALEWLCRQLEGAQLMELPVINYQTMIKILAIPRHQYPAAVQVEDVFKEVVSLMKKKFER